MWVTFTHMRGFNIMHCSLGEYWLTDCRFSQCWHSSWHNTNKPHSLASRPVSLEGFQFFQSLFFQPRKVENVLETNSVSCFHESTRLTALLSEKISATSLSLNNHNLLILSSKNDVSWTKWLVLLTLVAQELFLRWSLHPGRQQQGCSLRGTLKRRALKDWDLITFIFFTISLKTFLRKTARCFISFSF